MDHNKPLMVAAGHDSLQQIGGCLHGSISVTLYLWEWEKNLKRVVFFSFIVCHKFKVNLWKDN